MVQDERQTSGGPPSRSAGSSDSEPAPSVDAFRRALFSSTRRAWITPALVAVNAAVFLAMVATGVSIFRPSNADLVKWGADFGPLTIGGQWWRMLTNTFVHVGIVHIAMNMFGLWQVGFLVERLLGNGRFLGVYLLAGLCGSLASLAVHPFVVAAGASGAVFGIYGALLGYLARHRGGVPRPILQSLLKVSLSFLGFNLLFGLQIKGIDMAAHGGGFVGGAICAYGIARPLGGETSPRAWTSRYLTPGLVILAGLAVLAALASRLPRVADLAAEMEAFTRIEKTIVGRYDDAAARVDRGTESNAALAQEIETNILPPWRRYRAHIHTIGRVPPEQVDFLNRLDRYLGTRERGFGELAAALRRNDAAGIRSAHETIAGAIGALNVPDREVRDQPAPAPAAP
jgi:rhomboid protease GluP